MVFDMLEYYNMLNEKNISIVYNGLIWVEGVEAIATTLRRRLELDSISFAINQSIFSIFIELMNNMIHYSMEKHPFASGPVEKQPEMAKGVFVLGSTDTKYFIQCGNKIKNKHKPILQKRIDFLNTLNKEELRKYYKERLKAIDDNEESKGAGIGLIEIARRASSPIEYTFSDIDDEYSFFAIYVTIG